MTEDELIKERDGGVLVLTLNRPERMNALSDDLEMALLDSLRRADADPAVRAIVLTGGGRAFSAGYDMGSGDEEPDTNEQRLHGLWERHVGGSQRLLTLMEMEKPVITAVNGWCLGGAFWYVLASDVTFAGESAVFAQPEVRHVSATSFLFAALCGWKNAHRYGLTGDHFDAQEAFRIGVVNEVVPDEKVLEVAVAFAHRVAQVPAAAVRVNKAVTNRGLQLMGLRDAMTLNEAYSVVVYGSTDSAETQEMRALRDQGDMRGFLKMRDDPFRPEPGGPRSA